jgi:hypothetical protein
MDSYYKKYYEKNKEHIKELQRKYYHKKKDNPDSSHYLPYRLKLQRKAYAEKNIMFYKKKKEKHFPEMRMNRGNYEIKLD